MSNFKLKPITKDTVLVAIYYMIDFMHFQSNIAPCMMAFQLSYSNHEHLSFLPDRSNPQLFEEQFKQRLDFIKKMPASDFDLCYQDFNNLNNELFTHLRLSVDNHGILVERGADDAPARFRTASVFTGIIKELDRSFA